VAEKILRRAYEGIRVYVHTREVIMDSPDFTEVKNYIMNLWIMTTCILVRGNKILEKYSSSKFTVKLTI